MRSLICLSGQIRSFEPFFESFVRRVVARLPAKPDLVGHFAAPEAPEVSRLGEIAEHVKIRFEPDPELCGLESLGHGMKRQRHGLRGNLLQWTNLRRCADLKREMEREHGRYDLVFWTRPDLYFVTSLERLAAPPDRLHAPSHDNFIGVMDRLCFGPSRAMDVRMRLLDYFTDRFHPERIAGRTAPPAWNPEAVVAGLVEDELGGQIAPTRLVTLRLREGERGHEVCRPVCRAKSPRDGSEDPAFREVFRRSAKLDWGPRQGRPFERRLPLEAIAPLDAVDGRWPEALSRLRRIFERRGVGPGAR